MSLSCCAVNRGAAGRGLDRMSIDPLGPPERSSEPCCGPPRTARGGSRPLWAKFSGNSRTERCPPGSMARKICRPSRPGVKGLAVSPVSTFLAARASSGTSRRSGCLNSRSKEKEPSDSCFSPATFPIDCFPTSIAPATCSYSLRCMRASGYRSWRRSAVRQRF